VAVLMAAHAPAAHADVRQRAACAEIEMLAAIGERVDPTQRAACAGSKPSTAARTKKPDRSGKQVGAVLADVQPAAPPAAKPHDKKPDWVDRFPVEPERLWGVGSGSSLTQAFRGAVTVIAGQLQVEIDSETRMEIEQETTMELAGGREVDAKTKARETVGEAAQMVVKGVIDEVRIHDQYTEGGTTWVLAMLDVAAIKAREDAVYESGLAILSRATEQLAAELGSGRFEQQALFDVADAIGDLKSLGRTKMGRKVRRRWKPELRSFRRMLEKVAGCVELTDAVYVAGSKRIPASGQPKVPDGARLQARVVCNGKPITRAVLRTSVEGGLTGLPERAETDDEGRIDLPMGTLYGSGRVVIAFGHDTTATESGDRVPDVDPRPSASVAFSVDRPAAMAVQVSGVKGAEADAVREALGAWATRKWGAKIIAKGKAPITMSARIDLGPVNRVQGRVVQPVEVAVSVRGRKGTLTEKKGRTGAMASDAKEARAAALVNVGRLVQRW
jgi:hypothetical protein